MFFDALSQASENYQKNNTDTENDDVIRLSRMDDVDFETKIEEIDNYTSEEVLKNKNEGNYIRIMKNTPSVILDNVEGAEDLPIIIRFDALYLAMKKSGELDGHYHNLGVEIIKNLPEYISNPDTIVLMKNGRLNVLTEIVTDKGKNGIISIELNTVKDINSKNNKYQLVISAFTAKDNYVKNLLSKNAETVKYEKEGLLQVNPQLYEWLSTVNNKPSDNIKAQNNNTVNNNISENEEKYSLSEDSEDIRYSRNGISVDMTDDERYKVLKNTSVKLSQIDEVKIKDIDVENLERSIKSKAEKYIKPIADKLGITRVDYSNSSLDFDFSFTKKSLSKSLHSQIEYGGNYGDFVKMLSCFDELVKNAVLIETHTDKYKGTRRENARLKQTYVLLGAFQDKKYISPVQFEVKEYTDNQNRLYLAVDLTKIEPEVMANTALEANQVRTKLFSSSEISISDIFKKINTIDKKFLKYVPDGFLNKEQRAAKNEAIKEENEYINSLRYSLNNTQSADELVKENAELKEAIEILKQEFKLTEGHKLNSDQIKSMSKGILNRTSSSYDRNTLIENLTKIYEYIANDEQPSYDVAIEAMADLAKAVLSESSVINKDLYNEYEPMRRYFRETAISLSDTAKQELGDFNSFRKENFGRIKFRNDGARLDTLWGEISEMFPEFFPEDANEAEQALYIAEALDAIQPRVENPYGYDLDESAYDLALDLYDKYFNIAEIHTYADKQRAKITALRSEYNEKIREKHQKDKADYEKRLRKEAYVAQRNKRFIEDMKSIGIRTKGFERFAGDSCVLTEMKAAYSKLAEIFPDEIQGLTIRYAIDKDDLVFGWYDYTKNEISFNKKIFDNYSRLVEEYKSGVNEGHFPQGTDYRSCFFHEFGHHYSFFHNINNKKIVQEFTEKYWNGHYTRKKANEMLHHLLSRYATKETRPKYQEVIAECFGEWYNSNNPRRFCKEYLRKAGLFDENYDGILDGKS